MIVMSSLPLATFYMVFTKLGTFNESLEHAGEHHFMEHLLGITLKDVRDTFYEKGIEIKLETSDIFVRVGIFGLARHLKEAIPIFYERVTGAFDHYDISLSEIENERKVISNEYRMCYSNSRNRAIRNCMRKYYGNFGAIGRKDVIDSFSLENFERLKGSFNLPDFSLYIGPNPEDAHGFIREDRKAFPELKAINAYEDSGIGMVETSPDMNHKKCTNLWLSKSQIIETHAASVASLAVRCMSQSMNSPLYTEVRHKRGLAYFVEGKMYSIYGGIPFFVVNSDKPEAKDIVNDILYNPECYLTEECFRATKGKVLSEKEILSVTPTMKSMDFIREGIGLVGYNDIEDVTFEEVVEMLKILASNGYFFRDE